MKIKKAIKELKKDNVHCWREEENTYWVTNTYFLIRMNQNQFNIFKSKYSSLKRNAYIPDLEVGDKCSTYGMTLSGDGPDIGELFEKLDSFEPAKASKFIFDDEYRLYYTNNCVGVMQDNYYQIFEGYQLKIKSEISIVAIYSDNGNLVGLVMPVRPDRFELNKELKDLLNALEGDTRG